MMEVDSSTEDLFLCSCVHILLLCFMFYRSNKECKKYIISFVWATLAIIYHDFCLQLLKDDKVATSCLLIVSIL
jgi:hypothetical protein